MLAVVWLLMANSVTFGTVLLGVVFGIVLPIFTAAYWPDRPRMRFGRAMLGYVAVVLWDIVVANFQIAAVILFRRNRDLRPVWLVVPVELDTPEALTVLAATISLTPGTVSSDTTHDGRYLLVHALDVADPAAEIARIKERYEARLKRIFL
jgi:multicomponent K+:H+ antiporter subunit E